MFVFLLPYVCACFWGHVGVETKELRWESSRMKTEDDADYMIRVDMKWGVWNLPLEEYLIYKLESVMEDSYEQEALKAQAVLIRTEVIRAWQEQGDGQLCVSGEGIEKWYEVSGEEKEELWPYTEAVRETEGLYLCYQGKPIQSSYFKISNGQTRDAGEVWKSEKFPYLKSVSCVQDKAAKDYAGEVAVSKMNFLIEVQSRIGEEYPQQELWEGIDYTYDNAGYVTKVTFSVQGEKVGEMEGEVFRYLFGLPSASFETQQTDTQIIFHVTGVGHGFGMSQYGANCRAINGDTYDRILKEFFFGTELAKIE